MPQTKSEHLEMMLRSRAQDALDATDWPMLKSLANMLIELETHRIVTDAGRAAWNAPAGSCARCGRTDCEHIPAMVPMINLPVRDERPRALCACTRGELVCRREPGHMGDHEAAIRVGSPYRWPNAASAT